MVTPLDPLLTSKQTFRAPTQSIAQLSLVSEILTISDIMGFRRPIRVSSSDRAPLGNSWSGDGGRWWDAPRPRILNPWWIQRFSGFATETLYHEWIDEFDRLGAQQARDLARRAKSLARRQRSPSRPRRVSPGSVELEAFARRLSSQIYRNWRIVEGAVDDAPRQLIARPRRRLITFCPCRSTQPWLRMRWRCSHSR